MNDWSCRCHAASVQDVEDAVQLAHLTFESGVWSRAPKQMRAQVLERAASLLTTNLPELISLEVAQTGRVIREMQAQVPSLVRWFEYYAAVLRTDETSVLPTQGKLHNFTTRTPLGVVALITSFNHPLLIAVKKLAPALAAGNSVVLKPSELAPLSALRLGALLREAGLPDGVLSVLPGYGAETGRALVSHPLVRKVDVTGGTGAGRAIGAITGGNLARLTAELGGKAPVIVFKEADLDAAVNGVAFGAFIASGQTCVAATRVIVENTIKPKLLEILSRKAANIMDRVGSPTNPESMMGPIVSRRQCERLQDIVGTDDFVTDIVSGAKKPELLTNTSPLDGFDLSKGHFYPPAIMVSTSDQSITTARIWREEAFGPVVAVAGFSSEEEAVALANDSEFGLGAAVWTENLSQAFRVSEQIRAGIVWVNTHHRNDPSSPWGGATTASGVGSENGRDAYYAYTTTKSTVVNFASAAERLASDDWFREGAGEVRYG
jgi:acyl-CoA reductase-like NAD-dependent aldehyde dehydrogenase